MQEVEKVGGSLALTDAVTLLGQARERVADHIENEYRAMETVADLRAHASRIEGAINDIIGEMEPDTGLGAVNWADLVCVGVEVLLTGPNLIWTATVEEASPDADKFASLIAEKLANRGFPRVCVRIRTEW